MIANYNCKKGGVWWNRTIFWGVAGVIREIVCLMNEHKMISRMIGVLSDKI